MYFDHNRCLAFLAATTDVFQKGKCNVFFLILWWLSEDSLLCPNRSKLFGDIRTSVHTHVRIYNVKLCVGKNCFRRKKTHFWMEGLVLHLIWRCMGEQFSQFLFRHELSSGTNSQLDTDPHPSYPKVRKGVRNQIYHKHVEGNHFIANSLFNMSSSRLVSVISCRQWGGQLSSDFPAGALCHAVLRIEMLWLSVTLWPLVVYKLLILCPRLADSVIAGGTHYGGT